MKDWVWRFVFVGLWIALVVAGVSLMRPVFGYACDDCIGGGPGPGGLGYDYGEGGFKVDWPTVMILSVLNASVVT